MCSAMTSRVTVFAAPVLADDDLTTSVVPRVPRDPRQHPALAADDVLARHCFRSASRGRYFDEHGVELPGPIEPLGDHGLHSSRAINDQVSDALGESRAPED